MPGTWTAVGTRSRLRRWMYRDGRPHGVARALNRLDAAVLGSGRFPVARAVTLEEVPVAERAPILKRYLALAPGARAHIPVDRRAPVAEFEPIADSYPVFRIVEEGPRLRPA